MAQKIPLSEVDAAWAGKNIRRLPAGYRYWRETVNVLFGCVGFVVFIIVFPFAAIAILVNSQGPVLYRQQRVGKNGKAFWLWKFRTMYEVGATQRTLWREKEQNSITPVGRVLRRLHIDELPQAWNILKGEMHFIGPRPEWAKMAALFEKEIPFYRLRYRVKPGIIGWAQINFPPSQSVAEAREKFEYDLYYIANQSVRLDTYIILHSFKLFSW